MKKQILLLVLVGLFGTQAFAETEFKASSPVRVFEGPEGELVTTVEVNDSKQMLVWFRSVGGEIEGTARLYDYADNGRGNKDVTYKYKKGSKIKTKYVLVSHQGAWTFFQPGKASGKMRVRYSKEESKTVTFDQAVNAYKQTKRVRK